MYQLSNEQVDYIHDDLVRLGIRTQSIRNNLLDHICILLENEMESSEQFETLYRTILPRFYNQNLNEVEIQAQRLTFSRHLTLTKLQFFFFLFVLIVSPFMICLLCIIPPHSVGARVDQFTKDLWGPMLAYGLWPISSLLVLFLIPDSMDPPIARHAKIFIGIRPIIAVINC